MGAKGGDGTTTVQQSDPWAGQQPYLQYGFANSLHQLNSGGPQYYPNNTYVPFSNQTEQGLGMLENRAINGSPVESAMQNYVTNTLQNPAGGGTQDYLSGVMGQSPQYFGGQMSQIPQDAFNASASGQMLNANPYLDSMYDSAARRVTENFTDTVMPSINASFAASGGTGSGIQREMALDASDVLGQNLTDMANNLYGGNYARERAMQMNAANSLNADDLSRRGMNQGMAQFQGNLGLNAAQASNQLTGIQGDLQRGAAALAPTAANFDYNNINNLMGVGQAVEGKAGQALQDSINRFNYYQNAPENNLARYITAIQGNYGGTTSTEQDVGSNPLAGAAGGALTAGSLASTLGAATMWPWMLGGGILGGLLS